MCVGSCSVLRLEGSDAWEEIAAAVCWKAALIAAADQRGDVRRLRRVTLRWTGTTLVRPTAEEGDGSDDGRGWVRLRWTEEKGWRWCGRRRTKMAAAEE
ncbi:hypothetical protein GW17_00016389 [Ensete ventricosum]|nr:hypothetical protein GW17_00016389 [Ensete ventricosum]